MMRYYCVHDALDLPSQWDGLAGLYFRSKVFLKHTQDFNPCKQRYYYIMDNDVMRCGAIVYTLKLDLLTYLNVKSPVKMHIVGVPCSVSSEGIFGDTLSVNEMKNYICNNERGFILFINLKEKPENTKRATGTTLPSIVFQNRFNNWQDYMSALRAPYRHRLYKILAKIKELEFKKLQCKEFSDEMYHLYLQVYKRSNGRLEKLTCVFFKNLPENFKLTACYLKNVLMGWYITLEESNTLYFFLGGVNYNMNKKHHIYFNLLTHIIKDGIEGNKTIIELGQTAETPKMRLGGDPLMLYMEAFHSNKLLNYFLKKFSKYLSYKRKLDNTKSFKEEDAV